MLDVQEKNHVLGELNEKAKMTTKILNSIPGISCNEVAGAMYAFPRLDLPPKLCDAAKVCLVRSFRILLSLT